MFSKMNHAIKGSTSLEEAIEEWKQQGRDIPMREVPYSILHLVSRYFPPQGEWRLFAAYLGIERIQTLVEIEGDAKILGHWESEVALMYFATKATSNPPSFGDLITLLQTKLLRIDALQALYDSGKVEKFLQERKHKHVMQQNGGMKLFHADEHDLLQKLDKMVNNDRLSEMLRNFARNQTYGMQTSKQELAATLSSKCGLLGLQEYTINACRIVNKQPSEDDKKRWKELNHKQAGDPHMVVQRDSIATLPKAPGVFLLSKPTVLLTYCSDVENILPELVDRFRNVGICVVAEYVLQGKGILEINPVAAWESLFQQCHFVIPIISNKYLQQINRPDDTMESQSVRFVYDLYTGRYVSDGCRNHIVRPLIVSDVKPQVLRNVNPTLRMRWRIWEDVETLFKLVRDSFEARVQQYKR